MAKRAVITGITGQDGSYLAELLLEKGYEVFGVVRRLSAPNSWRINHLHDRITLCPGEGKDGEARLMPISVADVTLRAARPQFAALANDKLRRLFPMPTWQDALGRYLQVPRERAV